MELHGKNGVASLALWIEFPEKKQIKWVKIGGKDNCRKVLWYNSIFRNYTHIFSKIIGFCVYYCLCAH